MIRKACFTLMLAFLLSSLLAAMPQTEGQDSPAEKKPEKSAASEKAATEKSPPERGSSALSVQQSEMGPPVELRHVSVPIKLKLADNSRVIFESIGEQVGISMLFDPDFTPRQLSVDLNGVPFEDALKIVAFESKSFWRPVTSNSIFIAADNPTKHRELDQQIIKTFYLPNLTQAADFQDMINTLRAILQINSVTYSASRNTIIVRGTPDQVILAEKLMDDFENARKKLGEYRLEFKISEMDGEKKLNSRTYGLRVEPRAPGKFRVGSRVPVLTSGEPAPEKDKVQYQFQYLDVGANIDCQVMSESERSLGLHINLELSTLGSHEQAGGEGVPTNDPIIQQVRMETQAMLELGKPTIVGNFDDPVSKHTFQVEATATRLRE